MSIRLLELSKHDKSFEKIITNKLGSRMKRSKKFSNNVYACLCNIIWYNSSTNDIYSCSWRYAGGLVAEIRNIGEDYLDFYCTGGEGEYNANIYKLLNKLGYKALQYREFEHLQIFNFTGRL